MNKQYLITSILILLFSALTTSNLVHSSTSSNEIYGAALPILDFTNPENETVVGDIVSLTLETLFYTFTCFTVAKNTPVRFLVAS